MKNVSLVVACKNRNNCLQTVLPSWLIYDEIKEIIIVDWSSDTPLKDIVNIDERIKVIRVDNEQYYKPSQANNLGCSFATQEYILRIDTDYFLNTYYNFFENYKIDKDSFVSGEPENHNERVDNPYYKYLFGLLYISADNFNRVNGYNEDIGYYYSYEDGDIFDRLKLLGLKQIKLQNNHSVIHIPHPDKRRYEYFEGGQAINNNDEITVNTHISINQQSYQKPKNYYASPKVNWDIKQIKDNYFIAIKTENKLQDLPVVNCISLEESVERREKILNEFKKYNIKSVNFLLSKRYNESIDKIEGRLSHTLNEGTTGCCVSQLKNIKRWLETTEEDYGFFCEDDLSLQTVKYWSQTWKQFIEDLPQDWECVQLLTVREDNLHLNLRDRLWNDWGATAYILKRDTAKKIIETYIKDDVFKLELTEPDSNIQPLIENLIYTVGKTYTIPLFIEDINFKSTFVNTDTDVDAVTLHKNNHVIGAQKVLNLWQQKQNTNLLIGYYKGSINTNTVYQYIQTARQFIKNTDIVLVIAGDKLNDSVIEWLQNYNVEVYYYESKFECLYVDRFNAYKEFLEKNFHYTYILHTDLRDVYFQKDPFVLLDKSKIVLSLEGIPLQEETWNINVLNNLYPHRVIDKIKKEIIICSGIFGGPRQEFIILCEKILKEYIETLKPNHNPNEAGPDQGILNKIIYFDNFLKDKINFLNVDHPFCINLHLFGKENRFKDIVNITNKIVCLKNEPYSIVHQYDRVKEIVNHINFYNYDLYNFAVNVDNPEYNFKVGLFYYEQGHTAPALSFFLRCAERTENKLLAYEALIYGYLCYREQKIRDETAKSLIMHAICLLPERPEARWLLSIFFELKSEWMYGYYHACRGLETQDSEFEPLKAYKEYPGKLGLLFQKAIVGYWWGKNDECKNILLDLYNNYQLPEAYRESIINNLKHFNIQIT